MRTCIYCNRVKDDSEFSLEHVFPDALGGTLLPDAVFKTRDVCARCNNVAGLYVDGAFLKNWFRTNDAAQASREYLDPRFATSIPTLSYMGSLTGLALENDEVCEMWLGPCGIHYYHVHKADEPAWATYAGGNPINRKAHPGRVYIRLTTIQGDWVHASFRALMAYFPKARRYAPDGEVQLGDGVPEYVHQMDDAAKDEAEKIIALPDKKNLKVAIDLGFEQRFMAKLALGTGYNVLGTSFVQTPYAQALRTAMWERDQSKRATLGLVGTGFLKGMDNENDRFVGWKGAYTIRLHALRTHFVLSVHLPTTRAIHIVVSDTPSLWSTPEMSAYREGVVYIVAPQLGEFVGPVPLSRYVSYRLGNGSEPELKALDDKRVDPTALPPCR